ncbi:hypothetical protein MX629_00075 [Carnobacterium divergens]|uniref:Uncharacterized protein n=1 Tax=Carnobacterium divergens TaxID=2748 RepID=A0AAW8R5A4_CARDV|nr:hypothetical protein [Carnobacterium divergens]MDT1956815.1 hypothetical protein [Carnobacterium divergens]MDT1972785.1 hypothetical protein [Carnobacterium divergens]
MREKEKILKGLLFDGVITLQWSYQLIIIEGRKVDGIGLCYLNQSNTFFTCARTLYYMHNYDLDQELKSFFFAFSRYNHELLNYIRKEKSVTTDVSSAYTAFMSESKEILKWVETDLTDRAYN